MDGSHSNLVLLLANIFSNGKEEIKVRIDNGFAWCWNNKYTFPYFAIQLTILVLTFDYVLQQ